MPIPRALAERIAAQPFAADSEHRRLTASTSPASITLTHGAYEVHNPGADMVYLRQGAAVSVPSSGAAAVAGQIVVPAGGVVVVVVSDVVHVLTSSGSATLEIVRKPL